MFAFGNFGQQARIGSRQFFRALFNPLFEFLVGFLQRFLRSPFFRNVFSNPDGALGTVCGGQRLGQVAAPDGAPVLALVQPTDVNEFSPCELWANLLAKECIVLHAGEKNTGFLPLQCSLGPVQDGFHPRIAMDDVPVAGEHDA